MTTNIYTLDWNEPTRTFGADFNAQVADLDTDRIAIIDHNQDTKKSSLVIVDQSPTGSAASSADPQDWPVLDREFGRESWQAFVRDHEQGSIDMIAADLPTEVTATVHLAQQENDHDFITFETEDGEPVVKNLPDGTIEEGAMSSPARTRHSTTRQQNSG